MISVTMDVRDFDRVSKKWKIFRDQYPKRLLRKADIIGRQMVDIMRLKAPFWTGQLQDEIRYEGIRKRGDGVNILITSNAPHAAAQEYGYRPHFVSYHQHPRLRMWAKDHGLKTRGRPGLWVKGFTPHIRPTIEEFRDDLRDMATGTIRESLDVAGIGKK